MQYMLIIHSDDAAFETATPQEMEQMMAPYMAYNDALKKAGVWVAGEELTPAQTGKIVRLRAGKSEVLDGPFADVKEQFGGFYIVDVPSLDEALEWAQRCPGAGHGTVEVRAIVQHH